MGLYKIINADNKSCHGGSFDWTPYLPTKNEDGSWTPGQWTPTVDVEMCKSGYHIVDAKYILNWIDAQCYEVEYIGIVQSDDNDKYAAESIQLIKKMEEWNDKNLRLFACWCVRQVWNLLEDERSKKAIEVSEQFANGQATQDELAAAWDASQAAAMDSARAAAWAAAWAAARDSAWAAARDSARAAQSDKLIEMMKLEQS